MVEVGLLGPEQDRADYMRVQIQSALWKAAHHFEDGMKASDPPRAVRRRPTRPEPSEGVRPKLASSVRNQSQADLHGSNMILAAPARHEGRVPRAGE